MKLIFLCAILVRVIEIRDLAQGCAARNGTYAACVDLQLASQSTEGKTCAVWNFSRSPPLASSVLAQLAAIIVIIHCLVEPQIGNGLMCLQKFKNQSSKLLTKNLWKSWYLWYEN